MSEVIISVLLPVYNGATTIVDSIKSVQSQTLDHIELIVVDDGSTDVTPNLLIELAKQDPRIKVITKANSGIVDALNAGLRVCNGEFIARQDADDLSYTKRFEEQLEYLRSHPNCVAVSSAARHIDLFGKPIGTYTRIPPPDLADPNWAPSKEPYLMHPFLMIRRDALQKIGEYRYVHHSEDTDLYWRLGEIGDLHNLETLHGDYRFHPESISSSSIRNGRISAANSQLAAISATRRKRQVADLEFTKDATAKMTASNSIDKIYEIAAAQLSVEEAKYLQISMSAKLLELVGYRPYHLEVQDCKFLRHAFITASDTLLPENREALQKTLSRSAVQLIFEGRIIEAISLVPASLYGITLIRLIYRLIAPLTLRAALRKLLKKQPALATLSG